jgi:hypothetical protein
MSKSAGSAPQPPKFVPIDINKTQDQATQADITGYNLSDADLASRFPGLVSGRQQQVTDAYNQLTGPLDPTVQNSFVNQGLAQSLGAFGGGQSGAKIGTTGTASGNAVATSLANNVQQKQDYDRSNFENVLANNPQRTFGLSGADVTQETIANIIGKNNYLQARYGGQVGTANAQSAAANQQKAAEAAIAMAVLQAALSASDERIKDNIEYLGFEFAGIPVAQFSFKNDDSKKRHFGFIAQDVEKIKPRAVVEMDGVKMVDYGRIL